MTNTNTSITQADILWREGQPVSRVFDDVYFSRDGGMAETEYVFLQQNRLPERWRQRRQFVIGETGFGSGLNFLTTVHHWLATTASDARLFYIAIEKYPLSLADLRQALSSWPLLADYRDELLQAYPPAMAGFHPMALFNQRVILLLLLGDVDTMLQQLQAEVDAWYLDGFAPAKNPAMWTDRVFTEMARLSSPDASFSSFTAAGQVRRGLEARGFEVNRVKGFGAKRDMLQGRLRKRPVYPKASPWYVLPRPAFESRRAAVIGAGIAGMTTAHALAARGWQVDVFERHARIANEGSGNPAGVLLPRIALDDSAESEFYGNACQQAIHTLRGMKQSRADLNWHASGVMQLVVSERIHGQYERGRFDERFVRRLTPEQASDICGIRLTQKALYYPEAGWLDPVQLCQLLAQAMPDRIQLHCHADITQIDSVGSCWHVRGRDQRMPGEYDCVVLANAVAVRQFSQTSWLPLQPVRGQISYLASNERLSQLRCPVCYEGYILPAWHQRHLVGATFGPDDDAMEVRAADHQHNLDSLMQAIPDLVQPMTPLSALSGRAAVRAMSHDRMPLAGPVADKGFFDHHYADLSRGRAVSCYADANYLPGLYVNTGHGARGLTSGFLTAELLAAQINNEPLPVSTRVLHALLPARFLVRAYKKGHAIS